MTILRLRVPATQCDRRYPARTWAPSFHLAHA